MDEGEETEFDDIPPPKGVDLCIGRLIKLTRVPPTPNKADLALAATLGLRLSIEWGTLLNSLQWYVGCEREKLESGLFGAECSWESWSRFDYLLKLLQRHYASACLGSYWIARQPPPFEQRAGSVLEAIIWKARRLHEFFTVAIDGPVPSAIPPLDVLYPLAEFVLKHNPHEPNGRTLTALLRVEAAAIIEKTGSLSGIPGCVGYSLHTTDSLLSLMYDEAYTDSRYYIPPGWECMSRDAKIAALAPLSPLIPKDRLPSPRPSVTDDTRPEWVREDKRRILRFRGQVIATYERSAAVQMQILDAFASRGWPQRVEVDIAGKKLANAVQALNDKVPPASLRFEHSGSERTVRWTTADPFPPKSAKSAN